MPTRYRLPLECNPEFTALPSDPSVPLTPEQSAALWGGDVEGVLRSIVHGALKERLAEQDHATLNLVCHV
jgi:hypothetical protein